MLSVVSDFPTGHGERDQCYRDHGGYRRAEHQVGHVNSGQSFEHAGVRRFELLSTPIWREHIKCYPAPLTIN
jgi:hypothetical protein